MLVLHPMYESSQLYKAKWARADDRIHFAGPLALFIAKYIKEWTFQKIERNTSDRSCTNDKIHFHPPAEPFYANIGQRVQTVFCDDKCNFLIFRSEREFTQVSKTKFMSCEKRGSEGREGRGQKSGQALYFYFDFLKTEHFLAKEKEGRKGEEEDEK